MCRHIATLGNVVVDTAERHARGRDLLQAGLDVARLATLREIVRGSRRNDTGAPVPFKSCGYAGWDIAARD